MIARLPHPTPLQIGPGAPASADQDQNYDAELKGATWAVEREASAPSKQ